MKIIQLTAENVKKLTAVQITPSGNIVQITGRNGQGKTSVLDSIWWALAGTEHIQGKPIRKGAESARIELTLGDGKGAPLIVERRFTETNSYLTVKTAEGAKYPSPQKMLDALLGELTFDPLAFMRQDRKAQFETLRGLVKLDVDFEALDKANKADFETRTHVNRDARAKRAQAAAIMVEADLPEAKIDDAALLDRIQVAADENTALEQRKARREATRLKIRDLTDKAARTTASIEPDVEDAKSACDRECEDVEKQIKVIEKQIEVLRYQIESSKLRFADGIRDLRQNRSHAAAAAINEAADLQAKLDAAGELPEPVDIRALRASLDDAHLVNTKIADRERRQAVEADAATLEDRAEKLTAAITARADQKAAAISAAKMPIDGLAFGDGVVTFNDLPLDQASDAEQLMVSTSIAAALNPKLRVLRIRDGSLLDDDAMVRLAEFAEVRDLQVWIERVDGSGTVGIVMEDGHVRGQEQASVAAE